MCRLKCILFLLFSAAAFAQPAKVDSVYALFRKNLAQGDTAAWKELRLLEKMGERNQAALVYHHLGRADAFIKERVREQAFGACMDARDAAESTDTDSLLFRVNYKIGEVYMDFNDLPRALTHFNQALALINSVKRLNDRVLLYRDIALVYTYLQKNETAVEYFKKIIPLATALGNQRFLGSVYNNLGLCYIQLRDSALAREYLEKSLGIRQQIGDKHGVAQSHNNLGTLYYEWQNYGVALHYYKLGLELRLAADVPKSGIVESKINIGKTYYKLGKQAQARASLEAAREEAIQMAHIELERRANEELIGIYSRSGDFKKAFELQARFYVIRDSLYGLDKKEEIGRLTFEHKIREDSLRHAETRLQQIAVHDEKEKRSAFVRNFLVAGFLLVLSAAFLLLKQLRRIKEANQIIKKQRDQIEAKQKEVLDSIYYARRIQQSLFASETYINRHMHRLMKKSMERKG